MVQMGLTTSMIGLAAGQLLFGPLSDKYGRRNAAADSHVALHRLHPCSSIFASDIPQFVTAAFLRGTSPVRAALSFPRSVATDRFR